MTTNMNFGPEWMRGGVPKRSNTLDAQGLRSANSSSGTPGFLSNHTQSNNSGSAYSSAREQGSSTNANDSLGDSFDMRSNNTSENKSGPTYKYSKEFMLGLYKPVDVPADFERHDYVVVEESQGPLSFTDLTEEEKKLLAGPVHSEVGRRIITTGGDRPNNSRNNSHRDLHGSPAQSPGSENLPNTPGRMNLPRSKGRMHDYFSRRNDQDGARQREWSHSDSDKGPENSQEEIAWGGVNRDTVGSFDSDGVFRLGGSNCATSGALEDRSGRDWQAGFDTSIAKDFKRRGYDQQNDEISRDTFGTGQLRGSPFSDGINPTFGRGMESAHAPSAFSAETDFRDASPAASKPPFAYKWFYRDPQGNVQGPFDAQEMQGWYKSGFFTPTLLVKREDDVQFEPLMALIRRVGNDSEPFLTPAQTETIDSPASSHAAGLNLGLSSRTRGLDPFSRPSPSASSLLGGSTPLDTASGNLFGGSSAASDILSPQAGGFDFGGKYNTLGGIGGLQSSFLQQQLGQGAGTPQSPSLLQSPFGGTFGPSFLGSRDGASPWGERPRTPAWLNSGQSDMYGGAESPGISSLLQRQQQHGLNPLFGPTASSPGYMDYQRTMNDHMNQHQQYLQMLQQKQQQHLQFQQQLQQQLQQQQALESAGLSPHSPQSSGLGQGAFAANQTVPQSLETENRRLPGSVPVSTNSQSIHSGWGSAPGTPLSKSDRPVASRMQNKLVEQTEAVDIEPAAAKEKDQEEEALAQSMAKASIEAEPKPAPEPSPKEPATKPPSTVSKPVSLRDIQAEELRKQQEAKLQQQQQQQQAAKAAAASSENATAASTTSTKSGWGNSPWGLESTTKGPSLREIQEMEAREAEARKQAEAQQAATAASRISSSSSNTSWGVVTPSKTASSASVSTSAPAWGTTTAPKKTLREIQQEEEEAALRRAKAQQQAAANTMANSISSGAIPSSGRGYAGIAENAAAKATSSAGWTTVSAQRIQARITTSSTAPPSTTSHSSNTNRSTNTQNAWEPVGVPKQSPSVQQTAASRPAASAANNPKNSKTDGNKPPSDEFCRWCRQSLRGLNPGVNAEEILQMLLSFPLDNSSAEIIQDIIYANSTSMDGRRFADEFMKRRKADMAGKLSVTFPSTTLEDESAFQVVTKKGKKKTQA